MKVTNAGILREMILMGSKLQICEVNREGGLARLSDEYHGLATRMMSKSRLFVCTACAERSRKKSERPPPSSLRYGRKDIVEATWDLVFAAGGV